MSGYVLKLTHDSIFAVKMFASENSAARILLVVDIDLMWMMCNKECQEQRINWWQFASVVYATTLAPA